MKKLAHNIQRILEVRGVPHKLFISGPRLLLRTEDEYKEDTIQVLRHSFGVVSFSSVFVTKPDLEEIRNGVARFFENKRHFRVTVNRAWKGFPLTSIELQRILGSDLEKMGMVVDLENPDKTIYVEIREDSTYLFDRILPGPGGLPYGCQGRALLLFSGGLDSPVAGWMMGKRGVEQDMLFVNTCCDATISEIKPVYRALRAWLPNSRLYVAGARQMREEITNRVKEGYRQVIFKIILYKIAEKVMREGKYKAIITGESLGQVSSQTLSNLKTIQSVSDGFIIRPLVGMDKTEIVSVARKIGTYEPSSNVKEHCKLESHARVNVPQAIARTILNELDIDLDDVTVSPLDES